MDKKVDDVPLASGFVLGVEMAETLAAIEGLYLDDDLRAFLDGLGDIPMEEYKQRVLAFIVARPKRQ